MTHSKNTGDRWLRMALGVAAVTVLSGCYDDAVTDVTGEQPAVNVLIGPGAAVLPGGTLESAELQILNVEGFDLSVPDAFARATEPLERYIAQETGFTNSVAFDILSGIPGSNTDPRLPATTADAVAGGGFFGLFNPAFVNVEGGWTLFGEISGLNESSTYTVVLARMALDVRGQLDHAQILLGQAVEDPDSLYFLGGTETGYPGVTCSLSTLTLVPVTAATNPVALGEFGASAAGEAEVACVPTAIGDSPLWRSVESSDPPPEGAEDSIPVGVNMPDARVEPGMFNYLLLYESGIDPANPVPDGPPAVRIQIGPDIDSEGNVIANAFAPFPAGQTDPTTFSSLPGAGDAFVAPTVLNLNLGGLPSLGAGGTYAAYLFDAETESFQLLGTFDSEGATEAHVVSFSEEETGIDFSQFNQVFVSIETGAPGAAPSDARILVREFLSAERALTLVGSFTFGSANVTPAQEFEIAGAGTGTFIRDSLLVQLRRLEPAPVGFHYQSFLLDGTPEEFDSEVRLHTIELDDLGNSVDRIGEEEVGSFASFNTYVVALEPDVTPGLTAALIQVSEDYIDEFGEDYFLDDTGDDDDNGNGNGDT